MSFMALAVVSGVLGLVALGTADRTRNFWILLSAVAGGLAIANAS